MTKALAERLFETTIRIEGIWPIHGLTDCPSDNFTDAISYVSWDESAKSVLPSEWGDPENEDFDIDDVDWDDFGAFSFRKQQFGFFALASCPLFRPHSGGNGASFSWGNYCQKLFYADTCEAVIDLALAWADKQWENAIEAGKSVMEAGA